MVKGCGNLDDGFVFVVLGFVTSFCCLKLMHSFGILEACYYVFVVLGLLTVWNIGSLADVFVVLACLQFGILEADGCLGVGCWFTVLDLWFLVLIVWLCYSF